jgi:hypothetical protein
MSEFGYGHEKVGCGCLVGREKVFPRNRTGRRWKITEKPICQQGLGGSLRAPAYVEGIYRRALTDHALRISAIPEGRAVEPAVDVARVLSLCFAMFFPASLKPQEQTS